MAPRFPRRQCSPLRRAATARLPTLSRALFRPRGRNRLTFRQCQQNNMLLDSAVFYVTLFFGDGPRLQVIQCRRRAEKQACRRQETGRTFQLRRAVCCRLPAQALRSAGSGFSALPHGSRRKPQAWRSRPACRPGIDSYVTHGHAAGQEAADQTVLPGAELRSAARIFPHADHAERRVLRPLSPVQYSGGRRQDLQDRGRRRRRQWPGRDSRSTISRRCRRSRWSAVNQCSGNRRGLFQSARRRRRVGLWRHGLCALEGRPSSRTSSTRSG